MGTGLGLGLTSFSPGTTIASGSMNSNFSAINNSAVGNDSGQIVTDGGGDLTVVGLITGSGHILMPNNTPLRIKDSSGTVRDILYVDSANGTDLQAAVAGGVISFKDQGGTSVAGVNMTNHSFVLYDTGNVAHDVMYRSNNDLAIQLINNSNKLFIKNAVGGNIASIDSSGTLRLLATVIQSTTP